MSERQYNSKLINDKLAEIPVAPNDMLWAKLEAQLTAQPASPAESADSGSSVTKVGAVKVGGIIITAVALVVLIIVLFKNSKDPASQKTNPILEPPSIQQSDSIRADTTLPTLRDGESANHRLPKKQVPATPDNAVTDTQRRAMDQPVTVPLNKEPLERKNDQVILRPPTQLNIPPIADSGKVKPPANKKEEGYYFDVRKKKKKKNE